MATPQRSPRKILTDEEKAARDAKYHVDLKDFRRVLKGLVMVFNSLKTLNTALGKAQKGEFLAFPNPQQQGTVIPFNRKHLRSADAKFVAALKELGVYFRVSKKKARAKALPESLSSTYTPVFAAEALRLFFTQHPELFGPVDPVASSTTGLPGQALMDLLPMVQAGYLLRNTSTMLFYIYAHANQLQLENAQYARPDAVMTAAFGGNIAAAFYSVKDPMTNKPRKKTMERAIADGDITGPMNTFDMIQVSNPVTDANGNLRIDKKGRPIGFNPNQFNTYFYQNIAAANYYSLTALQADSRFAEQAAALANPEYRQRMLEEHRIVKRTSDLWKVLLAPVRKAKADAKKKQREAAKPKKQAGGTAILPVL